MNTSVISVTIRLLAKNAETAFSHPNRVNHNPLLLTGTSSKPSHSKSSMSVDSSSDDEFSCSPSLNISFEHAARIATLAESFSLTCFSDFQSKVVHSTLLGKDSIVAQPTGSGKSLCIQFPPVYQRKNTLLSHPQLV